MAVSAIRNGRVISVLIGVVVVLEIWPCQLLPDVVRRDNKRAEVGWIYFPDRPSSGPVHGAVAALRVGVDRTVTVDLPGADCPAQVQPPLSAPSQPEE